MIDWSNLFLFKIDNIDLWFWYIHHYNFFLIYHSEKIDNVRIFMFKKNLSFRIYMNYTFILPRIDHPREYYCVIIGSWEAQNFLHLLFKFYVDGFFK